jgi:predicted nucleic acid-binding Zn ribbon protein
VRYDVVCQRGHRAEIQKPMTAEYPVCSKCGAETRRAFDCAPPVHFAVAGFYSTDVSRFERQVGPEKARRFEHYKADVERRAKAGRLTGYEQAQEHAEATYGRNPV